MSEIELAPGPVSVSNILPLPGSPSSARRPLGVLGWLVISLAWVSLASVWAPSAASAAEADTDETLGISLFVTSGLSGRLVDGEETVAQLMATLEALADEARAEGRRVAVLDAGVTLVPYAESRFDAGDAIMQALTSADCRVFVPHPVDLTVGLDRLSEIATRLPFPVLLSVRSDDRRLAAFAHRHLLELGEVVIGLRAMYHPDYLDDLRARGIDARMEDPVPFGPEVDLSMAIVHSRGDGAGVPSRVLTWEWVDQPRGFDLVYDPDLGADLALRKEPDGQGQDRPVFLAGRRLDTGDPWQVAELRLELVRRESEWRLDSVRQAIHGPRPGIEPDPRLEAQLGQAIAEFRRLHDRPLPDGAPETRADLEAFVLASIREAARAEVAIINRGSLRPVDDRFFRAAPLHLEAVMRLLSYDQELVTGELTGAQLQELALESARRVDAAGSPRQSSLRFWGLDFEVEAQGTPAVEVSSFTVNGRQLFAGDRYRVVTNTFLAGGGDGYPTLATLAGELLRDEEENPLEVRDQVVLPRLQRGREGFVDLAGLGLWRYGIERLSFASTGVEVDADPAYEEVADSRARADDSTRIATDVRLFADQEWSALRWENRLRARLALLETDDRSIEQTDDLRFETSAVLTSREWLGANPYASYILDTELRRDEDDVRQLEQSLTAGLLWSTERFPRVRLALLARSQDDVEEAERWGLLGEAEYSVPARGRRPAFDAQLRAETLGDEAATIERIDLELRWTIPLVAGLSLEPGIALYRYEDSRLPGAADYRRMTLGLSYQWIGKWQRGATARALRR